jgi:hypothetical protein
MFRQVSEAMEREAYPIRQAISFQRGGQVDPQPAQHGFFGPHGTTEE